MSRLPEILLIGIPGEPTEASYGLAPGSPPPGDNRSVGTTRRVESPFQKLRPQGSGVPGCSSATSFGKGPPTSRRSSPRLENMQEILVFQVRQSRRLLSGPRSRSGRQNRLSRPRRRRRHSTRRLTLGAAQRRVAQLVPLAKFAVGRRGALGTTDRTVASPAAVRWRFSLGVRGFQERCMSRIWLFCRPWTSCTASGTILLIRR